MKVPHFSACLFDVALAEVLEQAAAALKPANSAATHHSTRARVNHHSTIYISATHHSTDRNSLFSTSTGNSVWPVKYLDISVRLLRTLPDGRSVAAACEHGAWCSRHTVAAL